ncbi:RDD family protein [Lysobacter humi (ex Lee et al. 2017)]
MSQSNADTGREWNPYELATPIAAAPGVPQSLTGLSFGPGVDAREAVEPVLAGRVARLLAHLINTALLMVPVGLVFLASYKVIRQYMLTGEVHSTTGATTALLLAGLLMAGLIAWNLVLLYQHGQSIGKRVIGIRIVRSDGDDASLARLVFMRFGALVVIGAVLAAVSPYLNSAFALINVLFIFTVARRCLHDHIADTIVVTA